MEAGAGGRGMRRWAGLRHAFVAPLMAVPLLGAPGDARADPVAIVEAVSPASAGVRFMDYVSPGTVIELGANGHLTLGYLRTCLREVIAGGHVRVGERQSAVDGGTVERRRVECDGGNLIMSAESGREGAAMVFRGREGEPDAPQLRVFSRRPFFQITGKAREIRLERIDRPEAPVVVSASGAFVDLKDAAPLAAGGLYRAQAGKAEVTFRVDAFATAEPGPILGRLVRL